MKKIYKITNIALIFTLIGVGLCQNPAWSEETSLRVPSSFQDGKQEFSKKFNTIADLNKKVYYYDLESECYTEFLDTEPMFIPPEFTRLIEQKNIELILNIEAINNNFKEQENVRVFNLGCGRNSLLSFGKYNIKNFDSNFSEVVAEWEAFKEAEKIRAKFEKKEISEIEEKCSVAIWYDLPYFIQGYQFITADWWKTEIKERKKRKKQILLKCLEHTWEIIEDGGYFIIAGSQIPEFKNFYPEDAYKMITDELNFDISEVHVIGESIKGAKSIILKKRGTNDDSNSLLAQKVLEGPFQVPNTDIFYKVHETADPNEIKETLNKWFTEKKVRDLERGVWEEVMQKYILNKDHPDGFFVKLESEKDEILGMGFFHKEDKFMFSQNIEKTKEDISTVYFLDLIEVNEEYRNKRLGEVLTAKAIERSLNDPDTDKRRVLLSYPITAGDHSSSNFLEKMDAMPINIDISNLQEDMESGFASHYIFYRPQAEELLRKIKDAQIKILGIEEKLPSNSLRTGS